MATEGLKRLQGCARGTGRELIQMNWSLCTDQIGSFKSHRCRNAQVAELSNLGPGAGSFVSL